MADNYPDLTALAANDPEARGRLWRCANAPVWTFAGAQVDMRGNLQIPFQSVPDARVQAALADGSWVPAVLDVDARPPSILAVMVAPAPGVALKTLTRRDLGTAAAA